MNLLDIYKSKLDRYSTGKIIILLLVFSKAVFSYMLFVSLPEVMEYSGGMRLLDMQPFGYSHEFVLTLFDSLGAQGRHLYLTYQIPIDMLYPLLFALSNSLLLVYLFKKFCANPKLIIAFSLIPIFGGLFDYLENIGIIVIIKSFPEISSWLSLFAATMTIAKSQLTIVIWILLLYALVVLLVRKLKQGKLNN